MIEIKTHKILVPIDFSETSIWAIKHAAAILKNSKGELILLNVFKRSDLINIILPAFNLKNSSVIKDYLDYKMEKLSKKIRKEYEITVMPIVALGNITDEIVSIAEKNNVGLIIMGTHGSDSTNSLFLGSNSYRVLIKSQIPVMTVRTDAPKEGYADILLPIDSSAHSRQKVNSAIKIADSFGARLHVLGLLGKHELDYEYKLKVILPQIVKLAREKHLVCTSEIDKTSNRAGETLAYAEKSYSDLIIIMTDQKSEFSGLILGTYAHQLINNSKIPVLCIPPEMHPENMEQAVIGGMWQR